MTRADRQKWMDEHKTRVRRVKNVIDSDTSGAAEFVSLINKINSLNSGSAVWDDASVITLLSDIKKIIKELSK